MQVENATIIGIWLPVKTNYLCKNEIFLYIMHEEWLSNWLEVDCLGYKLSLSFI